MRTERSAIALSTVISTLSLDRSLIGAGEDIFVCCVVKVSVVVVRGIRNGIRLEWQEKRRGDGGL